MKAIDRAKNHFNTLAVKTITVKQWADDAGNPLQIFVKPLTVKDREKLAQTERRVGQGLELIVEGILLFALDGSGQPLFTLEDKPDLMNRVDPEILLSIGNAMFDTIDADALKKN